MRPIDSKAFGKRVKERREELGISQQQLAEATGYSQSNIGWLEAGSAKRPQRAAAGLASALQTTTDWLLWEQGVRQVGPYYLPTQKFAEKYEALPTEFKAELTQVIENKEKKLKRKKLAG